MPKAGRRRDIRVVERTLMSPRLGLNRMWVLPKSSGGPPPLPAAAAATAAGAAPQPPLRWPAGAPLAAAPLAATAPPFADSLCCCSWPAGAGASCCRRGCSSVSSATLSRSPWSSKRRRWESTSSNAARFLRRQGHSSPSTSCMKGRADGTGLTANEACKVTLEGEQYNSRTPP